MWAHRRAPHTQRGSHCVSGFSSTRCSQGRPGSECADRPALWCWLGKGIAACAEPSPDPSLLSVLLIQSLHLQDGGTELQPGHTSGSPTAGGGEGHPPPKLNSNPSPLSFLRNKSLNSWWEGQPKCILSSLGNPLYLGVENRRKDKALSLGKGQKCVLPDIPLHLAEDHTINTCVHSCLPKTKA